MTGGEVTALCGVGMFLLTAMGVYFGIPAWRMNRHAERQAEFARQAAEYQRQTTQILAGDSADVPRSPDNPSVLDALKAMQAVMADVAELQAVQGWHMSDGHGPDMSQVFRDARAWRSRELGT